MRVLVIEDEPRVARTIAKGLESDRFAVDLASDGEEGLQLLTEIDYDAAVLDWNLPRLDGLTVLRRIRKARSGARILIVSARQDLSDRVCALESGADDYLTKPFSCEELVARLHALLRRPKELLDVIRVEDLELDRTRHCDPRRQAYCADPAGICRARVPDAQCRPHRHAHHGGGARLEPWL